MLFSNSWKSSKLCTSVDAIFQRNPENYGTIYRLLTKSISFCAHSQIPLKKSIRCMYLHAKNFVRQANLACVLRQLVNSTSLRQSCVTLSYKTCHRLWIYLSNESESRRLTNNFYLTFINPVSNVSPVLLLTLEPDLLNPVSLFPRTEMCRV